MAGPIVVSIVGDNRRLNSAISGSESRLQRLGGVAKGAGKLIAGGLAVAAAGAVAWGVASVKSLARIETINAQTRAAIKSTGSAAGVTGGHIERLAGRLEDMTASEAEATQEGANLLLTFTNIQNKAGKGNAIFDRTTRAMVDMSRAMGTDAKGQAIQLGKALNDPVKGISALQRVGVSFTEQQKSQIAAMVESGRTMDAQKVILGELEKQFGGSGKAFAETTQGQIELAKHAFGTLGETIFATVLPPLGKIAGAAADALNGLASKGPQISGVMTKIGAVVGPVVTSVVAGFRRFAPVVLSTAQTVARNLQPVITAVAKTFRADVLPALQKVIPKAIAFTSAAVKIGSKVVGVVLPPLIKLAGFIIGKVVPAIATAIGIQVKVVTALARFGASLIQAGAKAIDFAKKIGDGIGRAIDWVKSLPGRIAGAVGDAGRWLIDAGGDVIGGFISGLRNRAGEIVSAVKTYIADKIPGPLRKFLGIASPSKVTRKIGRQAGDGVAVGLRERGKDVEKAAKDTGDRIKKQLRKFATEVKSSALDFGSLIAGNTDGELSAGSIGQSLLERLEQTRAFKENLKALRERGLNKRALREIASAGVDQGGAYAAALAAGSADELAQVNRLQKQISKASAQLGKDAARAVYGKSKGRRQISADRTTIRVQDTRSQIDPEAAKRRRGRVITLSADELDAITRGKRIRKDLDAYEADGGRKGRK